MGSEQETDRGTSFYSKPYEGFARLEPLGLPITRDPLLGLTTILSENIVTLWWVTNAGWRYSTVAV